MKRDIDLCKDVHAHVVLKGGSDRFTAGVRRSRFAEVLLQPSVQPAESASPRSRERAHGDPDCPVRFGIHDGCVARSARLRRLHTVSRHLRSAGRDPANREYSTEATTALSSRCSSNLKFTALTESRGQLTTDAAVLKVTGDALAAFVKSRPAVHALHGPGLTMSEFGFLQLHRSSAEIGGRTTANDERFVYAVNRRGIRAKCHWWHAVTLDTSYFVVHGIAVLHCPASLCANLLLSSRSLRSG